MTPSVTSVSPVAGSSGTEITLTGSGFSVNASEVNVVIGGSACRVTTSNLATIKCTTGQSVGGSHEIVVKIYNMGFAKPSLGYIYFSYKVSIGGIQPNKGTIGGGSRITITGDGFGLTPNGTRVTIGGSICKVLNSSVTQIVCVTSPHGAGKASVHVTVRSEVGTLVDAFLYDSRSVSTVSSLSISEGSVIGGQELVINGTGFGVSKPSVKIGSNPCEVTLHSDSHVKCTTPANPAGLYNVLILVDSKGYAILNSSASIPAPPQFKYILEVTDISPRHGSILGGTVVTVKGRGFGDNTSAVTVQMGKVPCYVLSSTSSKIVCKTGASYVVHSVSNSGTHPGKMSETLLQNIHFSFKP